MSFSIGIRVSWTIDGSVRVEHEASKLLVTRSLGREWLSDRVSTDALEAEKARVQALAVEALRNLYDHKYKRRTKK